VAAVPAPPSRRIVRCPRCGGPSEYAASNAFRPFCSERCKTLDFGAWASEAYRVAAPAQPQAGVDADDAAPDALPPR
jgi:endogenous inhibitor of DNA gyrase (YacG/DUF329 family)